VMDSLQKLIKALNDASIRMAGEVEAMETRLKNMPIGSSPALELFQVTNQYKGLWDAQWSDDRMVGKTLGLTDADMMETQDSEFHMTANDLASEIVKSWRKSKPIDDQDEVIIKRLGIVADMLVYSPSKHHVSVTGHLWNHLTNMFILLAHSVTNLIKESRQLWRQSAISIVGDNPCHSAVMQAQTNVGAIWAHKIGELMEFSIHWLLKKRHNVVQKLLMKVPANKDYADDSVLNDALRRMGDSFLTQWTDGFQADFSNHLKKISMNIQQYKIQTAFNQKMAQARQLAGKEGPDSDFSFQLTYVLKSCADVDGAADREKEQYPDCKCTGKKSSVYCGTDIVAERKFNTDVIRGHPSCRLHSKPYCGTEPVTPTITAPTASKELKQIDTEDVQRLAEALNPSATDCDDLYNDLVNSGVHELALYLGNEMYYLAYSGDTPINTNIQFAQQMANNLIGEKSDTILANKFKSLGNRARLVERLKTAKSSLQSIKDTQTYFEQAHRSD